MPLVVVLVHAELGRSSSRSSDWLHDDGCIQLAAKQVVSLAAEVLQLLV
jgi:hypothetical protein